MISIDSGIVLDFPESWKHFTEAGRCIFHTPRREEIIVSASRVTGSGPASEYAQAVERVFANGLDAVRQAASHPELRVTRQLAEQTGVCKFRSATISAETLTRDVFFGQAVVQHSHGVIVITYEAPFVDGAEHTFHDLLGRIREG